jgi:hypothetical protein
MLVWCLIPIDLQSASWRASIYKGSVVVRAESEQQARVLACNDFSGSDLPVATTTDPPWLRPNVVRAVAVEDDPRFSAAGQPAILELR